MSLLRSSPARLWWLCWSCSCEPPSVVEDVADDEQEPGRDAEDHRHHLACRVVFSFLRVLPEEPVGWKEHEPNRRDMFLEVEEALRLPISALLNGDTDVDAIFGIDVRAHDEGENPHHAHRRRVASCRHRTKARHKPAGSGHF